jgi:hypothetical protein
MFITLSTTEVKAYRLKATSGWSLRWKAVLITDGPLGYMQAPSVTAVLPGGHRLTFDIAIAVDAEDEISNGLQGVMLWLSGVLDVKRPREGIVTIEVSTAFDIAGDLMRVEHRQLGVLRVIGV